MSLKLSIIVPQEINTHQDSMLTEEKVIRLIFGFKIRHLRQQKGLSYQELSEKTGLSTSYLNDIEKGKRYPKPDKINSLAGALDSEYNYLVALDADKKLKPIVDLITSKFFRVFPLETFGISLEKLVDMFAQTPDKINAFISTVFKIARNYQVDERRFYKEALRSYQDMHDNHFPALEESVTQFKNEFSIKGPFKPEFLEEQLLEIYGIKVDRKKMSKQKPLANMRSYFNKEKKILYLQKKLSNSQENFLIAREIGFQYLELKERPFETTIAEIDSFEKLLNNYQASHFASALLIDREMVISDISTMCRENEWKPSLLRNLIRKYNVTSETFMQRVTNILPHDFGLDDLFFIRLTGIPKEQQYRMTKDLHLSQLHSPYNNELDEHYCHRWLSITLLHDFQNQKEEDILVDAQISRYWNTDKEYLCLTVAKPRFNQPKKLVSITIGLLITPTLKGIVHFLKDPKLKNREVHTTCERCAIMDCKERVAPPRIIHNQESADHILESLKNL